MSTCFCMGCPHPTNCRCKCAECQSAIATLQPVDVVAPPRVDRLDLLRRQAAALRLPTVTQATRFMAEESLPATMKTSTESPSPQAEPCRVEGDWYVEAYEAAKRLMRLLEARPVDDTIAERDALREEVERLRTAHKELQSTIEALRAILKVSHPAS